MKVWLNIVSNFDNTIYPCMNIWLISLLLSKFLPKYMFVNEKPRFAVPR
jgi:hypothetical protein